MTPEQAIAEAKKGDLRPVYLVLGEETLLVTRVVKALQEAATKGGVAGFNEDKFQAGEASAEAIVNAAKMVPMMAKRRFVLARGLERWEKKADDDADDARAKSKNASLPPLDELAEYAKAPIDSTVMVLVAPKLHGQRKLVALAKKSGFLVACDPLPRPALATFVERCARDRGHPMPLEVAELIADISGPDLASLDDAVERCSLFVGDKNPIDMRAVAECVTRVSHASVWDLLDAIARRKIGPALGVLSDVFDPRDGGLPLLGLIAWNVRQMLKFESAYRAGASPEQAAARAGMPPFKAQAMASLVKSAPKNTLSRWIRLLAETDLALKGSKRPPQAVMESLILEMCA